MKEIDKKCLNFDIFYDRMNNVIVNRRWVRAKKREKKVDFRRVK